jgi:hypothetical protein
MGFIDKMRNKFKMGKAGPRKGLAGPPAILTRRPRERQSVRATAPVRSLSR